MNWIFFSTRMLLQWFFSIKIALQRELTGQRTISHSAFTHKLETIFVTRYTYITSGENVFNRTLVPIWKYFFVVCRIESNVYIYRAFPMHRKVFHISVISVFLNIFQCMRLIKNFSPEVILEEIDHYTFQELFISRKYISFCLSRASEPILNNSLFQNLL